MYEFESGCEYLSLCEDEWTIAIGIVHTAATVVTQNSNIHSKNSKCGLTECPSNIFSKYFTFH